jgi:hypothetical protein
MFDTTISQQNTRGVRVNPKILDMLLEIIQKVEGSKHMNTNLPTLDFYTMKSESEAYTEQLQTIAF